MDKTEWLPVKGIDELRRLATGKGREVRLLLNGGAYSAKWIQHKDGKYLVRNYFDGTRQTLSEAQLWTDSNIGQWLDGEALVYEVFSVDRWESLAQEVDNDDGSSTKPL